MNFKSTDWFISYAKFMVIFSNIMADLVLLTITILFFMAVAIALKFGWKILIK